MAIHAFSLGRSLGSLLALSSAAWMNAGCGGEHQDFGVGAREDEIIGGFSVTPATRRSLGLVDVLGNGDCSGSLIDRNWVLTAAHCIYWFAANSNSFSIPRSNGTIETRNANQIDQVGDADLAIVELAPTQSGSDWPSIIRPMRAGDPSALEGQVMTCYGRGATAYASPSGVTGSGPWRSLTRSVEEFDPSDRTLVTWSTSSGDQTLAPGDSGGPCFVNNQTVAVAVRGDWDCDDPNDCEATITKIKRGFWRSTGDYKSYIDSARLRPLPPLGGTLTWEPLAPQNGWATSGYGTNRLSYVYHQGAVHLRGAISTSGTNMVAFRLPSGDRPSTDVYIPISLCDSKKGRLHIKPDGWADVQPEGGDINAAKCFTSLDGVSFIATTSGLSNIPLSPGWVASPYLTRPPATKVDGGVVRLQGAFNQGTGTSPFQMPAASRPNGNVHVGVDLCDAAKGKMLIASNGAVTLNTYGATGDSWQPHCFTSIEGVSYAATTAGFSIMSLQNGWAQTPFGREPAAQNFAGIIRFHGAMQTSGTNTAAFRLPPEMSPATVVYVAVDLCDSAKGRLIINPDGWVRVNTSSGQWAKAQCRTSLEGAWFGL